MIESTVFRSRQATGRDRSDEHEQSDKLPRGVGLETELFPLSQARDFIPGRPHIATITRWRLTGVLDPSGERVKLRTKRVGGRHMTSLAYIEAFLLRLNADSPEEDDETEADVARHNRETRQALAALGIGSVVER